MPGPLAALGGITAIAEAIKEVAKLVSGYLSGAIVRKLKYRLEAAVSFVHVVYKEGEYKDIEDTKQKQMMIHFRKRIFDE